MADVFISYKSEDRGVAEALARDLLQRGVDVWWDYDLYTGVDFRDAIQAEIDRCKVAIVIWSTAAVSSRWVRAEATRALDDNKLLTTHVPGLNLRNLPIPFGELQSDSVEDREKIYRALKRRGIAVADEPKAAASATTTAPAPQKPAAPAVTIPAPQPAARPAVNPAVQAPTVAAAPTVISPVLTNPPYELKLFKKPPIRGKAMADLTMDEFLDVLRGERILADFDWSAGAAPGGAKVDSVIQKKIGTFPGLLDTPLTNQPKPSNEAKPASSAQAQSGKVTFPSLSDDWLSVRKPAPEIKPKPSFEDFFKLNPPNDPAKSTLDQASSPLQRIYGQANLTPKLDLLSKTIGKDPAAAKSLSELKLLVAGNEKSATVKTKVVDVAHKLLQHTRNIPEATILIAAIAKIFSS